VPRPSTYAGPVPDHEETVLRESLASHRALLAGALRTNPDLDLDGALQVHAGLGSILTRWSEFSATEQREIVATVEYLINSDDSEPDLVGPDGFRDDVAQLHRLQAFLGYV
jgi:hypothetical protein